MLRATAWLHGCLAAYVFMIAAVPLGRWNDAGSDALLPMLAQGRAPPVGDVVQTVAGAVPWALILLASRMRVVALAVCALAFDVVWGIMHYLSWWSPYVTGHAKAWQIAYANGPTLKLLPSFHGHIAPDGMHLVLDILLLAAFLSGLSALRLPGGDRTPQGAGGERAACPGPGESTRI
jgi:hypothetical protein